MFTRFPEKNPPLCCFFGGREGILLSIKSIIWGEEKFLRGPPQRLNSLYRKRMMIPRDFLHFFLSPSPILWTTSSSSRVVCAALQLSPTPIIIPGTMGPYKKNGTPFRDNEIDGGPKVHPSKIIELCFQNISLRSLLHSSSFIFGIRSFMPRISDKFGLFVSNNFLVIFNVCNGVSPEDRMLSP